MQPSSSTKTSDEPPEHLAFRRAVLRYFKEHGEWPQSRLLQRALIQRGELLDLEQAVQGMSNELGYIEWGNGLAALTLRGVALTPGSDEEMRDFACAMKVICQRYLKSDDEHPTVTSQEFRGACDLDDYRVKKLYVLLSTNPYLTAGSGKMADGSWSITVGDGARHFLEAADVSDYFRIADDLRERQMAVANRARASLPAWRHIGRPYRVDALASHFEVTPTAPGSAEASPDQEKPRRPSQFIPWERRIGLVAGVLSLIMPLLFATAIALNVTLSRAELIAAFFVELTAVAAAIAWLIYPWVNSALRSRGARQVPATEEKGLD